MMEICKLYIAMTFELCGTCPNSRDKTSWDLEFGICHKLSRQEETPKLWEGQAVDLLAY